MAPARDTVERYLDAFYSGDDQSARRYLADDLSFKGPGAAFSSADSYMKASEHARRAARGVETHAVVADGPDVCVFYDLLLDGSVGSVPVADWYHLDGGRIVSIRTILDTAPFTAPGGLPRGETARDPVCQMTVRKASAAATRVHKGVTHYFCSPGCAEQFEKEPERYLAH